ncbi:hypothetical protein EJ05DRAFT_500030 [Pseudovirgaria hyperparasitica]|uniref:C2H2-type domain-containing protein n=1 Tax=Pseudovirgaria hyperparasitica TaxID=470096 RepID=A0A6A6W998_9PEZI|nr:uncharacterized protein EJ05DRAFT_500030 [Pseudovirgaria hyperparasitica]KAF2758510.1 hypothetical protein EJ05DRAFT_500030 [Pseudovirgaria hyperparasitica]
MSKQQSAYGTAAGDTSFRKTWDRAEYAEKAAERDAARREEGRERYEAKLAGKKYHKRAATPPDAKDTVARATRLDFGSMVGKTQIISAGAAVGKRGRGAGFYCEACDLTFKDNIQWVEHQNSRQHLVAVGETGDVREATVEEVRERLRWLKRKKEEEAEEGVVDLGIRLEVAEQREREEREEKRRKRNERRRKGLPGGKEKVEDDADNGIIC